MPMSPSRAFARTVSESMRTPILSLGATSSSIACMIEGTPAITITLPIQKPGAPDTLLRIRSAPLGRRVMRRRASFISAPVVFTHLCRMASARGSVSIGTPNAFATQAAVMSPWVGPIPPVVKTAAMPERVERVDDRSLLVADHPHFLEINAERREIFCNIADVRSLVRPDRILPPITRSAAVTTSLEAGELAVGMITCGGRTTVKRCGGSLAVDSNFAIVAYAASSRPPGVASPPGRRTLIDFRDASDHGASADTRTPCMAPSRRQRLVSVILVASARLNSRKNKDKSEMLVTCFVRVPGMCEARPRYHRSR